MTRILTGGIGSLLVVAAIFGLPTFGFGLLCLAVFVGAVWEFVRIARHWLPSAPLRLLLVTVPVATVWIDGWLSGRWSASGAGLPQTVPSVEMALVVVALAVVFSTAVLLSRTAVAEALPAMGVLCFGTLYFAAPLASLLEIHRRDPWLLILTLAIVWLGDAAALYGGRMLGKRRLAPVVSPNKTWAGAVASFLMALAVASCWSQWRLGGVQPAILLVAGAVSISGQAGDLVESMIKRGAAVKDSGNLLPGHGGIYDRIDALLFGAPAMLVGLALLGW